MATSLRMSAVSGYPTETAMRVSVRFDVTYAGDYYTYFELYDDRDRLIDTAQGSTVTLPANGSAGPLNKTFSGLDPGTSYYIVGSLWNAATDTRLNITEPVVHFTTLGAFDPPAIVVSSKTSTTDSVTINAKITVNSSGSYYVRFEVWYLGTSQTHDSSQFSTGRTLSWTFSGIPSNTEVSIKVYVLDYKTDEQYDYDTDVIYTQGPIRPKNWSWVSNVVRGAEIPHTVSGDVVTCRPLTASEWNAFVDRVVEFREYLNLTTSNVSALYVSAGSPMTTDIPNAVRDIISYTNTPTSPPARISRGETITAAFFNGLKDAINSIK